MAAVRTRREPDRFRHARVVATASRTARLVRLTLGGDELAGLERGLPASSVRVLVPPAGDDLVVPRWTGNEFRYDDGSRPTIRTLTPLRVGSDPPQLDVEVVLHGDGRLSRWAAGVAPGAAIGVAGTGRGYDIERAAPAFVLAGDETALPAISVLLEELPATAAVEVLVEVADPDAVPDLPEHPRADLRWLPQRPGSRPGQAMVDAVGEVELVDGARVWVAGEAAAVQRIRRHLFDERGLPRDRATVRGYWKHGREAGSAG